MRMNIPGLSLGLGGGIGGELPGDQFSGRQSSKRDGIGRLNIGKAIAI